MTAEDKPEGKQVAIYGCPIASIAPDFSARVGRWGIRVPPTCPIGVQRMPIRTAVRQEGVYDLKIRGHCEDGMGAPRKERSSMRFMRELCHQSPYLFKLVHLPWVAHVSVDCDQVLDLRITVLLQQIQVLLPQTLNVPQDCTYVA